jgi:hypothetical protein
VYVYVYVNVPATNAAAAATALLLLLSLTSISEPTSLKRTHPYTPPSPLQPPLHNISDEDDGSVVAVVQSSPDAEKCAWSGDPLFDLLLIVAATTAAAAAAATVVVSTS